MTELANIRSTDRLAMLLDQVPDRGYLQQFTQIDQIGEYIFHKIRTSLFTGITFLEDQNKNRGFIAFLMGKMIYARLSNDKGVEAIKAMATYREISSFSSKRMTRSSLTAVLTILEGQQSKIYQQPSEEQLHEIASALPKDFSGVFICYNNVSNQEYSIAIFQDGRQITPFSTNPHKVLQITSNSIPQLDLLEEVTEKDFLEISSNSIEEATQSDTLSNDNSTEMITSAEDSNLEVVNEDTEIEKVWQATKMVMQRHLGAGSQMAIQKMQVESSELSVQALTTKVKSRLSNLFGNDALKIFDNYIKEEK